MEKPSKDHMIYEAYILVQGLVERVDNHSAERKEDMRRIYDKLDEIKESMAEESRETRNLIEQQNRRISKLETERNIGLKVMVPLIAAAVGFCGSWLKDLFFGRH